MRKLSSVLMVLVAFSAFALAQEAPKNEVFVGYSYLHANTSAVATDNVSLNGWNASVTRFLNKNVGVTADFSGAYGAPSALNSYNANAHNFLFGPTVAIARDQKVSGFAHVLVGAAHTHVGTIDYNDTAFGMAIGGGVDANINKHWAVRVAQVDYLYTNFKEDNQNNFRYSGGLVFKF